MPQVLKYKHLAPWTGGVQGITLDKPEAPWGLPLSPDQWLYFFCLAVMVVLFACARTFLRGHAGLSVQAIREHPVAAAAVGIDVPMYKALTFGISAMYAGVAGALGAMSVQFVSPDSFAALLSVTFLVGIVVGGLSSVSGAIYGSIFIQLAPRLASDVSKAAPGVVYGLVLMASVYLMPLGIAGGLKRLAELGRERARGMSRNRRRSHV
jgi:branched-chain amino acid transport system permease protein